MTSVAAYTNVCQPFLLKRISPSGHYFPQGSTVQFVGDGVAIFPGPMCSGEALSQYSSQGDEAEIRLFFKATSTQAGDSKITAKLRPPGASQTDPPAAESELIIERKVGTPEAPNKLLLVGPNTLFEHSCSQLMVVPWYEDQSGWGAVVPQTQNLSLTRATGGSEAPLTLFEDGLCLNSVASKNFPASSTGPVVSWVSLRVDPTLQTLMNFSEALSVGTSGSDLPAQGVVDLEDPGEAAQLRIVAYSEMPSNVCKKFRVELVDAFWRTTIGTAARTVTLTTPTGTGFYTSANCSDTAAGSRTVAIAASTSGAEFYWKASSTGTHELTADPPPGDSLVKGEFDITVPEGGGGEN